jgi:hypothetical protein
MVIGVPNATLLLLGSSRGAAFAPLDVVARAGSARAEPSERSESRRSEALRVIGVPNTRSEASG